MEYEVYIDKVLIVSFLMNYISLSLVNRSSYASVSKKRMIAGAIVGTLGFLFPLICPGGILIRTMLGGCLGFGMIAVAFPIHNMRAFFIKSKKLTVNTFFIGGGVCFVLKWIVPKNVKWWHVVCAGMVIVIILYGYRMEISKEYNLCKVTLKQGNVELTIFALIDSGNGLVEPISGKPVCVVNQNIYAQLFDEQRDGFRVIPYHSIGRKYGVMHAGKVNKLCIYLEDSYVEIEDVYLARGEEVISINRHQKNKVGMILHPDLLHCNRERLGRKKERDYDYSDGITGKTTS